jgi:LCP family protein required for cell wall assembly
MADQWKTGRHRQSDGDTPRRKRLRTAGGTVVAVLLLAVGGAGYLYLHLNGNIKGVDINGALGTNRPKNSDNGSMDILVLGSDSRSGANKTAGGGQDDGTARSDTAMIVHVYKGHEKATVVSIPRDTLVDRPSCTTSEGKATPAAQNAMFNDAYSVGGPACAVKTVEALTGIRMDHYIEIDFTGFQHLIDALGGVPVTTTRAIDDNGSHLHLAAGTHTLDGEQALGLVRTRHAIGDGSDLGRIQLQQDFMKALMARVDSIGLLSSPTKIYKVANTATSAITTDSDLASVTGLTGLAESLKAIGSNDLTMITMPVEYDPADPNRVIPITARTDQVWAALSADRAVPKSATKGSAGDDVTTGGLVKASS